MNPSAFSSRRPGPFDETIDASAMEAPEAAGRCMDLVEGSGACLMTQTRDLLRSRLRAAALVLFVGFAAFLVWHFFLGGIDSSNGPSLFATHVLVTLMLGVCAASLCRKCPSSMPVLRLKELLVFGTPALFFFFYQYVYVAWSAATYQVLPNISGLWLMLIFTYALFIPNSWPRAARVTGAIAAAPAALTFGLVTLHPICSAADNAGPEYLAQTGMLMVLGAVTATIGVHTIGRLRHEAFEAQELGRYRLRQRLGGGGMGDVYLAEHQLMKRPCAIKVIRPDKAGDPRVLARFEREVQATAQLSHWNTIEIFDYGRTEDGTFYYVMEYLPGMSLGQLVDAHGPLPAARTIHLLRQVCEALREAHAMGLIHRDIKPANVFAAQRGGRFDVAKLLDFGMVKPLGGLNGAAELTQEGSITGSPLFMAPEQATGAEPDARTDIYALGAVAYQMLTGRPPFAGDNPMKILVAQVGESPTPPAHLNPDVPLDLQEVVLRCLAKEPRERYADVIELAEALDGCYDAGRWTPEAADRWWREQTTLAAETPATVPPTPSEPEIVQAGS